MASFVVAEQNRFFHSCTFGKDDSNTDNCYLKKIVLSMSNYSNSHASLYNYDYFFNDEVTYPFHVCCSGDELLESGPSNVLVWGNALVLKLSGTTNAHAATVYSEPYWENASFQAPGGIYCVWSETQPEVSGNNEYLSILSLSTGESNNHLGNAEAYPLKLWCRGGIPMKSAPEILAPNELEIILIEGDEELIPGEVIDDSSSSEEEGFFAKKECENVDECVALVDGTPECFSKESEYDVDDFTNSGLPEICSDSNYWCPKYFSYDPSQDYCKFDQDNCFDQTSQNIDKCWSMEKNETTTYQQHEMWLLDFDQCSYKDFSGTRKSCCLTTIIHGNPYQKWKDVCILEAGGDNEDCAP